MIEEAIPCTSKATPNTEHIAANAFPPYHDDAYGVGANANSINRPNIGK